MSNKHKTIEDQLFTYEGWEYVSPTGDLEFENVTLKVAVGEYPAGTKFASALLSAAGILGLSDGEGNTFAHYLNVTIGDRVDIKEIMSNEFEQECHEGCCREQSN